MLSAAAVFQRKEIREKEEEKARPKMAEEDTKTIEEAEMAEPPARGEQEAKETKA